MFKQRYYLITALLLGSFAPLRASSVVCSLQTGASGPTVSQACDNIISPAASTSWSTVISSTSGQVSGPLTGSIEGDSFTASSTTSVFEGAVDTALAWNGYAWYPAFLYSTATTFAGHFNSNTTDQAGVANTSLGDNLLGIVSSSANPNTAPTTNLTLSFASALTYVEFQVSSESGTNSNFIATLTAYDSHGNVLGRYQAVDTGSGGLCPSLSPQNPSAANPPVACNDAASVQFYDPQDRISSVLVTVNDPNGAFIDTLEASAVPEPSSFMMFAIGAFALLWVAKRDKLGRLASFSRSTTRD